MGKGLALQFKMRYPAVFQRYKADCNAGKVQLGKVHAVSLDSPNAPFFVINFPTKGHWREQSRYVDIAAGLADLRTQALKLQIKSIAMPALGCGLGGLDWGKVLALIEEEFKDEPLVHVYADQS